LQNAFDELRDRSNKDNIPGLTKRRIAESTMLDSRQAPFYSKPSDDKLINDRLPRRKIVARVAETIIPRGVKNWDKKQTEGRYYIWRTTGDEKVRKDHEVLDGKIFEYGKTPIGKNPGGDYNCRCVAELLSVEIEIERDMSAEQKLFTEVKMISLKNEMSIIEIKYLKSKLFAMHNILNRKLFHH
jgi:SPP1 gp7 family putative phage head morphogenesis protein